MSEKIITLNPNHIMKGRKIDKEKYDKVKSAILQSLENNKEPTHT